MLDPRRLNSLNMLMNSTKYANELSRSPKGTSVCNVSQIYSGQIVFLDQGAHVSGPRRNVELVQSFFPTNGETEAQKKDETCLKLTCGKVRT